MTNTLYSDQVILPDGLQPATLILEDGQIVRISKSRPLDNFIDYSSLVIMPGIIDPHVHINEPGRTNWEGFDSACRAAAAGGITTMIEMPLNASPVTTTIEALAQKLEATKGKLHVNCGFWGGIIPANAQNITPLLQSSVFGIKAFLTHSGIDEFPNVSRIDLEAAMPLIANSGKPLLVHCELDGPRPPLSENPKSYAGYLESRPDAWEVRALELMIELCQKFDCRVHIVHLATQQGLELVQSAKKQGLPITVETCQHYLYFAAENIPDGRCEYKCAPPIRGEANRQALWQAVLSGLIDFVATDHSPAPPNLKELETGNLQKAWGGIAGLQFALPALWTAGQQFGLSIEKLADLLCKNPARLASLSDRKGQIKEGFDADLCIWNPKESFVVEESMIFHRHKTSPYLGERLQGRILASYVGGQKVFENGKHINLAKGELLLSI